ncbi:nitrogen fixation protein NifB [Halanaerobium saccharolyticum]|uniref:FeMo cofactor biosynthesis protein NifB n=1 Tax=Halanaerobium saccharolyticum TaxID=43595 RepID=A0A4R6M427_9FIRM|nr:nitrogenase cofactor biosynthesis protein NifB [Halanaerobium saccharolyticum]TDO94659.1 nitrogen fixation protein NifB [Halanaerobium saccharolyticum]
MDLKTKTHPCYSKFAHNYARMHIPVAAKCNISCNYCNRKYDCLHETRPGVTSKLLSPTEALARFKIVKSKVDNLSVVGVAGPGDALASFEATRESLELIKAEDPDLTFCLSTNGLSLTDYQEEILRLGVSHVTITINAVEPEIGAKIYERVNYKGETLTGVEGAELLLKNQLSGLKYLAQNGVLCKVNIVLIKGINNYHIEEVVKTVKEAGAFMTNIMPLIPVEDTPFADNPLTSKVELDYLRNKCEENLKQMYHCQQCRSDAVGCLNKDRSLEFKEENSLKLEKKSESLVLEGNYYLEQEERLFAVASQEGEIVNLHFGHAKDFYIYQVKESSIKFIEKRNVEQYCTDKECSDSEDRIGRIINTISDCEAVLSVRIGTVPRRKLLQHNIIAVMVYDKIESAIRFALGEMYSENTG